jgi:hypothetical protein
MTNYTTTLQSWGDSGAAYPSGYSYTYQVPPIEEYDNFAMYHSIEAVLHLIDLTNERLDSSKSATSPSTPTDGELWWDTTNDVLNIYDTDFGDWKRVGSKAELDAHTADTTNPHSVTYSQVGAIQDAAGTVTEPHLGFSVATQAELDSHTGDTTNPHSVTAAQVGAYTTAQADSNFAASGHNHDTRYYTQGAVDDKKGKLKHFATVTDAENDSTVDVGDMVYITGDSKVYVKTA